MGVVGRAREKPHSKSAQIKQQNITWLVFSFSICDTQFTWLLLRLRLTGYCDVDSLCKLSLISKSNLAQWTKASCYKSGDPGLSSSQGPSTFLVSTHFMSLSTVLRYVNEGTSELQPQAFVRSMEGRYFQPINQSLLFGHYFNQSLLFGCGVCYALECIV